MDSDRFVKLPWLVATSGKLSFGARLLYAAIQDKSFNGSAVEVGAPAFLESIGTTKRAMLRHIVELSSVGLISVVSRGNHISCKRVIVNDVDPTVVRNLHGPDVRESLTRRFCRMPSSMVYARDVSVGSRIVYAVLVCEGFGKPEAAVTISDVSKAVGTSVRASKRYFMELSSFGAISRNASEAGRVRGLWTTSIPAPTKNGTSAHTENGTLNESAATQSVTIAPTQSVTLAPTENGTLNDNPLWNPPKMNNRRGGLERGIDLCALSLGNSNSGESSSIGNLSGTEERPSALPPTPTACRIVRLSDYRAINCTNCEESEMSVDTKAAMSVFGRKVAGEAENCPTDEDGDGPVARKRTKQGGNTPRTGSRKGGGISARTAMVSERMTVASNAVVQPKAEMDVSGDRMMVAHRVFAVWCEEMSKQGHLVPSRLSAWDATKLLWIYDEYIRFGEDYVFRYLRWVVRGWEDLREKIGMKGECPGIGIFDTGYGTALAQMFYKKWVEQNGVPGRN